MFEKDWTVFNQTFPVYEILFLDDASSDNSVSLFREYARQPRKQTAIRAFVNSSIPAPSSSSG
ncbi:glycosyltransferase [Cohnella faecalis]|uniref:glycosyltransferase n=1 Tax=Cohnella faecalis TaxID=2315694 RepID=UPI00398900FC